MNAPVPTPAPPAAPPTPAPPSKPERSRWRRWSFRVLGGLVLLILGVIGFALSLIGTEAGTRWAALFALEQVNTLFQGDILVGDVEGTIAGRLILHDVRLVDDRGEAAVFAKRIEVRVDLLELAEQRVHLSGVVIEGLDYTLFSNELEPKVLIARVFESMTPSPDDGGPPSAWRIDLDDVVIRDARYRMSAAESPMLSELSIALGLHIAGGALDFPEVSLSGVPRPGLVPNWAPTRLTLSTGGRYASDVLELPSTSIWADGVTLEAGFTLDPNGLVVALRTLDAASPVLEAIASLAPGTLTTPEGAMVSVTGGASLAHGRADATLDVASPRGAVSLAASLRLASDGSAETPARGLHGLLWLRGDALTAGPLVAALPGLGADVTLTTAFDLGTGGKGAPGGEPSGLDADLRLSASSLRGLPVAQGVATSITVSAGISGDQAVAQTDLTIGSPAAADQRVSVGLRAQGLTSPERIVDVTVTGHDLDLGTLSAALPTLMPPLTGPIDALAVNATARLPAAGVRLQTALGGPWLPSTLVMAPAWFPSEARLQLAVSVAPGTSPLPGGVEVLGDLGGAFSLTVEGGRPVIAGGLLGDLGSFAIPGFSTGALALDARLEPAADGTTTTTLAVVGNTLAAGSLTVSAARVDTLASLTFSAAPLGLTLGPTELKVALTDVAFAGPDGPLASLETASMALKTNEDGGLHVSGPVTLSGAEAVGLARLRTLAAELDVALGGEHHDDLRLPGTFETIAASLMTQLTAVEAPGPTQVPSATVRATWKQSKSKAGRATLRVTAKAVTTAGQRLRSVDLRVSMPTARRIQVAATAHRGRIRADVEARVMLPKPSSAPAAVGDAPPASGPIVITLEKLTLVEKRARVEVTPGAVVRLNAHGIDLEAFELRAGPGTGPLFPGVITAEASTGRHGALSASVHARQVAIAPWLSLAESLQQAPLAPKPPEAPPTTAEPAGPEPTSVEPTSPEQKGVEQKGVEQKGVEQKGVEQKGVEPTSPEPTGTAVAAPTIGPPSPPTTPEPAPVVTAPTAESGPTASGILDLSVTLTGTLARPTGVVTIQLKDGRFRGLAGLSVAGAIRATPKAFSGRIEAHWEGLSGQEKVVGQRVLVEGAIPIGFRLDGRKPTIDRAAPARLNIETSNIALGPVLRGVGATDFRGLVRVDGGLSGSLGKPRGRIAITGRDLRGQGLKAIDVNVGLEALSDSLAASVVVRRKGARVIEIGLGAPVGLIDGLLRGQSATDLLAAMDTTGRVDIGPIRGGDLLDGSIVGDFGPATASGNLVTRGTLLDLAVTGDVSVVELRLGGERFDATIQLSRPDANTRIDGVIKHAKAELLTARGSIPGTLGAWLFARNFTSLLQDPNLSLDVDYAQSDVVALAPLAPGLADVLKTWFGATGLSARASIRGAIGGPTLQVSARVGSRLAVAAAATPTGEAEGEAPAAEAATEPAPEAVPVEGGTRLLDFASLFMEVTPQETRVDVVVMASPLAEEDGAPAGKTGAAGGTGPPLFIHGLMPIGTSFLFEGPSLPFDRRPITAWVRSEGFRLHRLRRVLPELVGESSGEFYADLNVRGSIAEPDVKGGLRVRLDRMQLRPAGLDQKDVDVTVLVRDRRVVLFPDLHLVQDDRHLRARFSATVNSLTAAGIELDGGIQLDRYPILGREDASAVLTGHIDVSRTLARPHVVGSLRVDELILKPKAGGRDIRPIGPPDTVIFVDGLPVPVRLQRNVADAAERAGAFVEIAIDLDIPRRAVRVQNDQIDVWAEGRLRVETSGERLALLGRVTVNEGSVDFIGRSFVIDPESAIIFDGREGIDPLLDLSARYSLADVDLSALGKSATASDHILLKVRGRLSKPKPDFTAVPDLSQTDILAIIAVGFPVGGDGGTSQSNTGRVGNMLMNLVSAQASRIIQDRLPVDVFKVEAGADDISKSKITVGKRLLRDLVLSYNANFGAKDGENKNEAQLRYEITNNVQLEARYGDAGYGGADLFLLWRF